MQSRATSVEEYLAELPEDRRRILEAVREVILDNLDPAFEEGMQYGMIGYYVPHRLFPAGYHCDPKQPLPYAGLASQKNHSSFYFMPIYGDSDFATWFREAWAATGKKLDMGKSCIRFKRLEDLPLDLIGKAIGRVTAKKYIARYEAARKQETTKAAAKPTTKSSRARTKAKRG